MPPIRRASPGPETALVPEFEVQLPLGYEILGSAGPRGPAMNALDVCPKSDILFVANGRRIFAFRLEDLAMHAAWDRCGTGSSSSSSARARAPSTNSETPLFREAERDGDDRTSISPARASDLRACWTSALPRQINRLRCGVAHAKRGGPQHSAAAEERCGDEVCAAVCDDGTVAVFSARDVLLGDASPRQGHWHNASSTWGLAFAPEAKRRCSAQRSLVVVSANSYLINAFELFLERGKNSPALEDNGLEEARQRDQQEQIQAARPALPTLTMRGHSGNLPCVDVSPDSCELASTSLDGTLRTWSLITGKEVASRHCGAGWSVLYLPLSALASQSKHCRRAQSTPQPESFVRKLSRRLALLKDAFPSLCPVGRLRCVPRRRRRTADAQQSRGQTREVQEVVKRPQEHPLPEEFLGACIMPFMTARCVFTTIGAKGIAAASKTLLRAAENTVRGSTRREWLLFHIADSSACLRQPDDLGEVCADLPIPFPAAFAHVSIWLEESMFFISSSILQRGLLWVVRAERRPRSLAMRLRNIDVLNLDRESIGAKVLGHAVVSRSVRRSRACASRESSKLSRGSERGSGVHGDVCHDGESTRALGACLYVLLSSGKLLCFRLQAPS